jgi:hypothetical protein
MKDNYVLAEIEKDQLTNDYITSNPVWIDGYVKGVLEAYCNVLKISPLSHPEVAQQIVRFEIPPSGYFSFPRYSNSLVAKIDEFPDRSLHHPLTNSELEEIFGKEFLQCYYPHIETQKALTSNDE